MTRGIKLATLSLAFAAVAAASAYLALTLIIQSEETVVVPDLAGKEVVYALELLAGLGLDIKVKGLEFSNTVPKHHVIFQQPDPGAEIKKGRDVKIILSRGPVTVILPDLQELPLPQARVSLEENGLCLGNVSRMHHPAIGADLVIAQHPHPGMPVTRTECVDLLISEGRRPDAYLMPDLVGLPADRAVLLLARANLKAAPVGTRLQAESPVDSVLQQRPPAGTRITSASAIEFVVNRLPLTGGSSYGEPTGGMRLLRHRAGSGYLRKHLRAEIDTEGGIEVLFNDFLKPGEEIWLVVPNDDTGGFRLYEDDRLIHPPSTNSGFGAADSGGGRLDHR